MFDRIPVYAYLLGALGSLVIGLGLMYADVSRIGPVFLFACVLLTILAAIRFTTPPIERSLIAEPASAAAEASAPTVESSSEMPASHSSVRESLSSPHESPAMDVSMTHDDTREDS